MVVEELGAEQVLALDQKLALRPGLFEKSPALSYRSKIERVGNI